MAADVDTMAADTMAVGKVAVGKAAVGRMAEGNTPEGYSLQEQARDRGEGLLNHQSLEAARSKFFLSVLF